MEIPDVMLNILIGEGFEKLLTRLKKSPVLQSLSFINITCKIGRISRPLLTFFCNNIEYTKNRSCKV